MVQGTVSGGNMVDVLITGGSIVDGTGAPARQADVAVSDGRIVAIGDLRDEVAGRRIDVVGLVVAPGFVDVHTHYDAQLMWDPAATPSPMHGVTTVIGGNCGFTIAPLEPEHVPYVREMMARVEGMPLEVLEAGTSWDWRSFGEWLDRFEGRLAVNAGFLVGHSTLRRLVLGDTGMREAASPEQVRALAAALDEALASGGLGFSSSLAPTHNDGEGKPVPSRSAEASELLALCGVTGRRPGTSLEFIPPLGAFDEQSMSLMSAMSRAADRPLNWNLLSVNAADPEGHTRQLAASDHAAAHGGRVLALTLPDVMRIRVNFVSGFVLDALPGWSELFRLPLDERIRMLRDPTGRTRLRERAATLTGPLSAVARWNVMTLAETFAPENSSLEGRLVGDIARERGADPFDVLCEVVVADELRTSLQLPGWGDDDETWRLRADVWRDPRTIVGGSDAGAHLDMSFQANYATIMLSEGVRKRQLLTLEEAVHQLTDVPARLYGLTGRGRVAIGAAADLVLFDPEAIGSEKAGTRFDLPGGGARLYADAIGIDRVLVGGSEIVIEGRLTGAMPGTVLRSGVHTKTVSVSDGGSG